MSMRASGLLVSHALLEVRVLSPARPTRPTSDGRTRGSFRRTVASASDFERKPCTRKTAGRALSVATRTRSNGSSPMVVSVSWPAATVGQTQCSPAGTNQTSAAEVSSSSQPFRSSGWPRTAFLRSATRRTSSRLVSRVPVASKTRAPFEGSHDVSSATPRESPVPVRSSTPTVAFVAPSHPNRTNSSNPPNADGRRPTPTFADPPSPFNRPRT
mmetsp:Transcript_7675/g.23389  ORF Transcript_7675/g.23389 Transcript_7675/m.23389 type:complete len:214 (-) Transcript_7675:211-852(-)